MGIFDLAALALVAGIVLAHSGWAAVTGEQTTRESFLWTLVLAWCALAPFLRASASDVGQLSAEASVLGPAFLSSPVHAAPLALSALAALGAGIVWTALANPLFRWPASMVAGSIVTLALVGPWLGGWAAGVFSGSVAVPIGGTVVFAASTALVALGARHRPEASKWHWLAFALASGGSLAAAGISI